MQRNRKIVIILSVLLLILSSNTLYANQYLGPNSVRCQPSTSYRESSVSRSQSEQFSHMAYKSPVSSNVTLQVTLTSTLSLKTGISADMKILLAKSSINFEMSYTGSRQTSTSISWNVPAGGNYRLTAGKEIADVIGKVSNIYSYCNITNRNVNVKGSFRTYHKAVRE